MKKQIFIPFILLCLMSWPMVGLSQDVEPQSEAPELIENENDSSASKETSKEEKLSEEEEASEENGEEEKLNINFASIEDLLWLTGGNEELTRRLAEGRPYKTLDDLMTSEGMTEEIFVRIRKTVEIRKLNLNDATVTELMLLPGVDQPIARAIIEHRPYKIVEELLKIRGISEKTLQEFQEQIEAKPARKGGDRRGWNIKKRSAPLKSQRPLEKRPAEEEDDFFHDVSDDKENTEGGD